jgi:DNA-binding Xre family transcriptional regulator
MDGNSTLTNSTLAESLNAACAVLADCLECQSGKLTAPQIAKLPDYLFDLAVLARWLPKGQHIDDSVPLEDSEVVLGDYVVQRSFREEFVSLVHQTLNELEPIDWDEIHRQCDETELIRRGLLTGPTEDGPLMAHDEPHEPRPTPKELMDCWQRKTGFSLEELAHQAGIGNATLYRIRAGKFPYGKQRESLKALAAVIECNWQDLIPARQD